MPVEHVTVVPSVTPRGGVVVLQEAFGVTPYLLDVARRLATAGWSAAVPHLYHRSGSPAFAYDANADRHSWQAMIALFDDVFATPASSHSSPASRGGAATGSAGSGRRR